MIDFLHHLTIWHWLNLGIAFLALELLFNKGYCFWFAIVAGLVGFLVHALPVFPWELQVIVFSVFALLSAGGWHHALRMSGTIRFTGMDNFNIAKKAMGETFVLEKRLKKLKGKVSLGGRTWVVRAKENFEAGTSVTVSGHDGVILILRRAESEVPGTL